MVFAELMEVLQVIKEDLANVVNEVEHIKEIKRTMDLAPAIEAIQSLKIDVFQRIHESSMTTEEAIQSAKTEVKIEILKQKEVFQQQQQFFEKQQKDAFQQIR